VLAVVFHQMITDGASIPLVSVELWLHYGFSAQERSCLIYRRPCNVLTALSGSKRPGKRGHNGTNSTGGDSWRAVLESDFQRTRNRARSAEKAPSPCR